MTRFMLVLSCAVALWASGARGVDLQNIIPGVQLGFNIRVVPGPKDTSRARGLVVAADKILSDKHRQLAVIGTITNFSDMPCENIDMRFAVSSYIGTGYDRGRATVHPSTIPPGGTATFSVHISLGAEKPRNAIYTINASSPIVYGYDPGLEGRPMTLDDLTSGMIEILGADGVVD